jgi:phage N-6-adenine-methyltransferase
MDWQTPDCVLDRVRQLGPIALDPCTTEDNPCGARYWFCPPTDALQRQWLQTPGGITYVNCPYGRALSSWVAKCADEGARPEAELVLLVPARPDTGWYDRAEKSANALCEWRGRLTFRGAPSPAPFPSVLFYWGPSPWLFCHVFAPVGRVRVLRERAA